MNLYQAKEYVCEDGHQIVFTKWKVVRETEYYYFCSNSPCVIRSKSSKLKKIHKTSSRFAFKTKKLAFENLLYRKRKHLNHLKRDFNVISALVAALEDKEFKESDVKYGYGAEYIPVKETKSTVRNHYIFD